MYTVTSAVLLLRTKLSMFSLGLKRTYEGHLFEIIVVVENVRVKFWRINIFSFSQTILNSSISAQHKINYQKLTNEHFKSSPRFKKNLLLWTDLIVAAAALEFINLFWEDFFSSQEMSCIFFQVCAATIPPPLELDTAETSSKTGAYHTTASL